jgi:hypothetical protein
MGFLENETALFEQVLHAEGAFVHHQGQPATEKEPGIEDRKIVIGQSGQKGFDKLRKIE